MKEFLRAGDRIFEDILHSLFGNDIMFLLMTYVVVESKQHQMIQMSNVVYNICAIS